ncbi:M67 family metallopeptidase [Paenibacillus xylaniclasticus]|uniref:M67 family metallopeptidase n=1 Tax=Paenibacillus xylaniclasticus TaxID=588083 RepID=UPI000FDB3EE2|nr:MULTISPECIES: M67 family metallopeptidase [Paenibacillus]GFN30246.1 hypothetical protein PCURB6_05060 [Paenibacillus curdlanolyticus]
MKRYANPLSEYISNVPSNEHLLCMSNNIYKSIAAHCQATLPNEACGLLSASFSAIMNSHTVVERFIPIPNIHPEPLHAFAFEPSAWTAALYELDRASQQIIGFYHSHPATAPVPSKSDMIGLPASSSTFMLILSFASPIPEARAYRFTQGKSAHPLFSEVKLHFM